MTYFSISRFILIICLFLCFGQTALADTKIYYVHNDHLGTPKQVTDVSNNLVWEAHHTPFGEAKVNEDADNDGEYVSLNIRFPGQYYDQETGLHYNWNRYYNPKVGRYITSDPIGLEGGINTYTYAEQNSINNTDPTGMCPWCVAAVAGGLTDLTVQLGFNGFDISSVNWTEVGLSAVAGAAGVGIAQKFGKISTSFAGKNRPTYRFFKVKDKIRIESHPISRKSPDWYSYPHWHAEFLGKRWKKYHLPLIEPLIGFPALIYNWLKEDGCY